MKRRFRLARSTEIKRVRRAGRNYAHPLLVLSVLRNNLPYTRVCIIAGSGIGNAVQRNRAKRRIRAAVHQLHPKFVSGFDVVMIARKAILTVSWKELTQAMIEMAAQMNLLKNPVDDGN